MKSGHSYSSGWGSCFKSGYVRGKVLFSAPSGADRLFGLTPHEPTNTENSSADASIKNFFRVCIIVYLFSNRLTVLQPAM